MTLAGLKSGAMLAGVVIGGGALVGAGLGAVQALNGEPSAAASGFNGSEQRNVLANVIIGAGVGALGGVALIGAKKVFSITALKSLSLPAMMALGTGTGAAAFGAYTLGRNVFN